MAARTSLTEIQKVLNTSIDDATLFIDMAHSMVEEVVVPANTDGALDENRLKNIETYLAAHFVTVYEPVARQENAGPTGATYHGVSGMMLFASIHGQMAIFLDTTGSLAKVNNGALDKDNTTSYKKASTNWAGTGLGKDDIA